MEFWELRFEETIELRNSVRTRYWGKKFQIK